MVRGQPILNEIYSDSELGVITEIRGSPVDSTRLFVQSDRGKILIFDKGEKLSGKRTFLDISNKVTYKQESGMLGFDFHPNYEENGYFYAYYIIDSDTIRSIVSRFRVDPENPDQALKSSEEVLINMVQPTYRHNGGKVAFGPDGYLYISFGDGHGYGRDRLKNGQDRTNRFGSIIRINVDGKEGDREYSIPNDNQFVGETCNGEPCQEEIYAYGLRNPWRFSFDSETGRLWLGDVGHNNYEEINVIEKGGNYGWPKMEGNHCHVEVPNCDTSKYIKPVFECEHETCGSISGGFVYRGSEVQSQQGKYIFADYLANRVWSLDYEINNGKFTTDTTTLFEGNNITTFGTDQDGELYMGTVIGEVYRMQTKSNNSTPSPTLPDEFKLYANFPNPFNPATAIKFDLPEPDNVEITVYDIAGNFISTLVNRRYEAGTHSITFSGEGLASGVYLYELKTGSFTKSKKMMLLR